ncbi:MAG: acyltransferase, partial [Ilumatobacteraceae bacterium]
RLERPRWMRVSTTINRFSMPLFLFHTTGMALERAARYALAGHINEARDPSLGWWLYRPLAFIGPLLFTLPVIYLFGRQWRRKRPASVGPAAA